jgi:hypothetical protein
MVQAARDFWDLLKPGGKLHPSYLIEHQGHLVFEVVLSAVIAYLLFQRSYKPSSKKQEKPLTEKVHSHCIISGFPFCCMTFLGIHHTCLISAFQLVSWVVSPSRPVLT